MSTGLVIGGRRSFQGSLQSMQDLLKLDKHKPPAAQLAIDELVAYHKAVREFNQKTQDTTSDEKPPKKVRKNR